VAEDEQHRPRRHGYDVSRLLALSDGVFAIAMTLLVLDIPAPGSLHSDAELLQALRRVMPNVLTFGLSFALVALYWIGHRRLFRDVARTSAFLVQLNVLLLLLVCLVPFTAGVLTAGAGLALLNALSGRRRVLDPRLIRRSLVDESNIPPTVIVPGIMGSGLLRPDETRVWLNLRNAVGQYNLSLPFALPLTESRDELRPGSLLGTEHRLPRLFGFTEYYDLLELLEAALVDAGAAAA